MRCIYENGKYLRLPTKGTTEEKLREAYDYRSLRLEYPWAKRFRAGFIILHQPEGQDPLDTEILLVKQKACDCVFGGVKRFMPGLIGPPKGGSESTDKSAFDTALRELKEETGVTADSLQVLPWTFAAPRSTEKISEFIVYFMAVVKTRPEVIVDGNEIEWYKWYKLSETLDFRSQMISVPTRATLRGLIEIISGG